MTDRQYDLITSEPPPPLMDGITRLYSKEYYQDALAHLTPTGCMTQWLPTWQMPPEAARLILRTFVQAFPHTFLVVGYREDFVLVGSRAPFAWSTLAARLDAVPGARADLVEIELPTLATILAHIVIPDAEMRRVFNCGIGMVLITPREDADDILERLSAMGERTYRIGVIERKAEADPPLLFTSSTPGTSR